MKIEGDCDYKKVINFSHFHTSRKPKGEGRNKNIGKNETSFLVFGREGKGGKKNSFP
jgi:hypothetical protein